jgi:hypothetical protein
VAAITEEASAKEANGVLACKRLAGIFERVLFRLVVPLLLISNNLSDLSHIEDDFVLEKVEVTEVKLNGRETHLEEDEQTSSQCISPVQWREILNAPHDIPA